MEISVAAMLICAGFLGGIASAIAGGASLITFPAMLAAGLPPVIANASNAVATSPSHLVAAFADRSKLPSPSPELQIALAVAALAGGVGAFALLLTPERWFVAMVPVLIGLATLLFAFGKRIQRLVPRLASARARIPLLAGFSVYGGYFGAGLGVMLLALIGLTGREEPREANALKNLFSVAVSVTSVAFFISMGMVRWPETFALFAGAVAGGYLGGRLVAILPAALVRGGVIAIGSAMSVIYAWRLW